MSAFDPDNFLDSSTTEEGSTYSSPIPPGEYDAIVKEVSKPRSIDGKDGNPRYLTDITWELVNVSASVMEEVGRDQLTVRQTVWLDLTSQGQLDMGKGKNIGLNQVRDALGQNKPGQPWSPKNMIGASPAKLMIGQRPDRNDPTRLYADVKRVGKIS